MHHVNVLISSRFLLEGIRQETNEQHSFVCWPTVSVTCPLCALLPSVMDKNTATGWDPADVAQAVLKAVRHRSKDVVLAGAVPTLAVYLRTLWPALFFKVMSLRARKEQKPKNEWRNEQEMDQRHTHTDRNMELGGNVNVFNNSSLVCDLSVMKHTKCENVCSPTSGLTLHSKNIFD